MRYMIITYMARIQRRDKKIQQDEIVQVAKRIRPRDLDSASVILDFQTRSVLKSSVGDQIAPRDFQRIRDYYHRHYPDVIDQLENAYHEKQDNPG
jgi:ribosomal protein L22